MKETNEAICGEKSRWGQVEDDLAVWVADQRAMARCQHGSDSYESEGDGEEWILLISKMDPPAGLYQDVST